MKTELDRVEQKLRTDIDEQKSCFNFTVGQKREVLAELKEIRNCKDYRLAIGIIKTARNQRIAHRDFDYSKNVKYVNIQLICKNIWRCFEIRELVLRNISGNNINTSVMTYDYQNIVEALRLQKEVHQLRKQYEKNNWTIGDKWYSSDFEFWEDKLKPMT